MTITQVNDAPALHRLMGAVVARWPEHERFLRTARAAIGDGQLAQVDAIAADALAIAGPRLDQAIDGYRWMCGAFLDEEIHFRRHGAYRCTSMAEAFERVYSDPEIMRQYMDGSLLSQALWSNHTAAMIEFTEHYVTRLPPGGSYLEFGCGHGLYFARAARGGALASLVARDLSRTSLEATRVCLGRLGIDGGFALEEGNIMAEPTAGPGFDAVTVSEILEHLEDPLTALRNCRQLLKPGGLIFINFPLNSPAPDHITLLRRPQEVLDLATQAGFTVERSADFPMTGYSLDRALKADLTVSCTVIGRKS